MIEHHPVDPVDIEDLRSELMAILAENEGRNRGFIVSADVVAALLNIVEALAEQPPIYFLGDGGVVCAACKAELRNPHDTRSHFTGCVHRRARALVGPASGARTEAS